jgi:multiple sugar transport system permease protein
MVSNTSLARSQSPPQRTTWERLKVWVQRDSTQGYLLIAPALVILLALLAYPFLLGLYMSLTEWPVGGTPTFVGFKHFVENWESSTYRLAVTNTALYTFVSVACKLVLGFAVALLLNQEFVGRRFVRAAVLLPWIVPIVLSAQAWKWMFDPNLSALNWILRGLGLSGVPWLSDPTWARISVITVNIWRGLPFYAINFLAGLQTVPQELYEAAAIDGAGRIGRLIHVTIPQVLPVIIVVLLISTIGTVSDFGVVWALTGGGPAHATEVLATYSYVVGLRAGFLGRGASVSLTMFPLLLALVFLNLYYIRRRAET